VKSVILTDTACACSTWNWGYLKKMKKSHNMGPVLVGAEIWGCPPIYLALSLSKETRALE